MARTLAMPDATAEDDLKALVDMFNYYTLEPSGQIPTGTNREITQALNQKTQSGLPYIPANHPAINADGELIDRWQTPYFFHAQSSQKMEIHSAGPDREMFTTDDLVWPPSRPASKRPETFVNEVNIR